MAQTKTSATSTTSNRPTAKEVQEFYNKNKNRIENFDKAIEAIKKYRDVTKSTSKTINTFNKEKLRTYLNSIGSNENNLRNVSRYLFYRSHVYYRLVKFYSDMWDLRCRKVVPKIDLSKGLDSNILKNYNATLDVLDRMNLHGNMTEILQRVYVEDVCYAITYYDDTGMFFYILDPQYCKIDGRYQTGDFSFSVDMSHWKSAAKQQEIEWLGEPFVSMYREYDNSGIKWVHCPDEYAACFKFRTDDWETIIPPFLSLFNSLIGLEDLADVQAIADKQQIYKLVYLPMKVLSGADMSDDWAITPEIMLEYFSKLLDEALPEYAAGAVVPGDELGVIDFSDNAKNDTDRVEQAATTVLNTSGGGMVLNTSKITTNAGFEAALKNETEFAISTLLPQINSFANRFLIQQLGDKKACKVDHFEVSIYTKDALKKSLLESCQYSFSNKLAYNTLNGISEKETIAMQMLEEDILKLHEKMIYPLSSSFTSSGNNEIGQVGQGAPTKDSTELSPEGDKSRNK